MERKRKIITREEIQRALRKFQATGGLIKWLPDEKNPPGQLVGAKWAVYEPVLERFSILAGIE